MKYKTFIKSLLTASAFMLVYACTDKKAADFKEVLAKKESQATDMLLSEKGLESAKLNYLIAYDYPKALNIIDKEEIEFNNIIKDIEKVNTAGISKGQEIQQAEINYYTALKDLYIFSRKEIEQEKQTKEEKDEQKIRISLDKRYELALEKQKLYQKVYKADEQRFSAQKQFESENNLK
ncbi:hypothetical protein ACQWU4_01845 [Chryseobacterium sp. MIQD13]|uniref:hypothetical protein n=1 Tax=Chryseobacterium sp. MIQD13 TaxID=3422310 RepID=UPI003D27CC8E